MSKDPNDVIASAASVATSFLKNLIGLDESLEEFKKRWAWGKEGLSNQLKQERLSYQETVVRLYKRASGHLKKFMLSPDEDLAVGIENDLEEILIIFARKKIPGAGMLSEGCTKQVTGNILDVLVDYFGLLDVGDLDGIGPVEDSSEEEDEEDENSEEEDEEGSEEEEEEEESEEESGHGRKKKSSKTKGDSDDDDSEEDDDSEDEDEDEDEESDDESGSEDGDDDGEDDEEGDESDEKKIRKKKSRKHQIGDISEPLFQKDPDAEEAPQSGGDEGSEGDNATSKTAAIMKLAWTAKGQKGGSETDSVKRDGKLAAQLFKELVGLDDELQKWKEEWKEVKEMLENDELDDHAKDFQVQVLEVFNHKASLEAKEFMESPFEDFILDRPEEVERVVKELYKLDVPGASFLLEAFGKFKVDKLSEQLLDYFDLLKQEEMAECLQNARIQEAMDLAEAQQNEEEEEEDGEQPDPELIDYFQDAFEGVPEPPSTNNNNFPARILTRELSLESHVSINSIRSIASSQRTNSYPPRIPFSPRRAPPSPHPDILVVPVLAPPQSSLMLTIERRSRPGSPEPHFRMGSARQSRATSPESRPPQSPSTPSSVRNKHLLLLPLPKPPGSPSAASSRRHSRANSRATSPERRPPSSLRLSRPASPDHPPVIHSLSKIHSAAASPEPDPAAKFELEMQETFSQSKVVPEYPKKINALVLKSSSFLPQSRPVKRSGKKKSGFMCCFQPKVKE